MNIIIPPALPKSLSRQAYEKIRFPRSRSKLNPPNSPVVAEVIEEGRNTHQYSATVPNAFHTMVFNVVGSLKLEEGMRLKDGVDRVLLGIKSKESECYIDDFRTDFSYVLSRKNKTILLFVVLQNDENYPIAVVMPRNGFGQTKADIVVPCTNKIIGSVSQKWLTPWGLVSGCRSYVVKVRPDYDILLLIAVQFCYEMIVC